MPVPHAVAPAASVRGEDMSRHKYAIGDRVRLAISKYAGDVPPGTYTISRQLPAEANVYQYRVRHLQDGHERVVRENQIAGQG
jgi:hypothetical protein